MIDEYTQIIINQTCPLWNSTEEAQANSIKRLILRPNFERLSFRLPKVDTINCFINDYCIWRDIYQKKIKILRFSLITRNGTRPRCQSVIGGQSVSLFIGFLYLWNYNQIILLIIFCFFGINLKRWVLLNSSFFEGMIQLSGVLFGTF